MGIWQRIKSIINSGNEYQQGDSMTVEQLNGVINNSYYTLDIAEGLIDTPDVSAAGNVGTPTVQLIDNTKTLDGVTKTVKKFKFSNLKGATGATGLSIFIRYATSSAGANMVATPSVATKYVGFYQGATASTNAANYTWSQYVGKGIASVTLSGKTFTITYEDATTQNVTIDTSSCRTTNSFYGIVSAVNGQTGLVSTIKDPNKTYLIADVKAGDNYLPLKTGTGLSFTIQKGDVSAPITGISTGGEHTLNYSAAGRYIITIDGTFNGFDFYNLVVGHIGSYIEPIEVFFGMNCPIASGSFDGRTYLKSIHFLIKEVNNSEYTIENRAFSNCSSLGGNLDLNYVTSIGEFAFYNCPITNLVIEGGFGTSCTIGEAAFNSTKISNLVLPNRVSTIGANAFGYCEHLTTVRFLHTTALPTIASNAFSGSKIADIIAKTSTLANAAETAIGSNNLLTNHRKLY